MNTLLLTLTLALPLTAAPRDARATEPEAQQCTPEALFADVRAGLRDGSPALKKYLRSLLAEAALGLPAELLLAELAGERDPAMIEALGAALAMKAENSGQPALIQAVLARATHDADPAARAAAVRALRGTGSVELMRTLGDDVSYERLIRDDAADVRAAVVDNLIAEDEGVYSGHSKELSEAALRTAFASEDGAATARLLAEVSTEAVGPEAARSLVNALDDDRADVRAASARAIGALSPPSAGNSVDALMATYRADDDLAVRRTILESLARLVRRGAIPLLEQLRPVDARLDADITAWIAVLGRGLPEWSVIARERARLSPQKESP